ncbi:GT2 family glycosyltransferase [Marisediminicola sp. UYEF4]|uniref:glycosyltransferase family 2 protein n=1 Tax=Marisediminicola sp. UYEF4 TaxID=1756384 RepID=UPI003397BDB9
MIDCLVIVVAYKSARDLPGLIESIPPAMNDLSWRAVVVDNYGEDDLRNRLSGYDHVTVIDAGANLGYSGGLNHGMAHAESSRFVLFLNPDLVLEPAAASALLSACVTAGVVAAVPLVLAESGAPQPSLRREPTVLRSAGEAVFGDRWPRRPHWLAEMIRDGDAYAVPTPVDWATGAALLVRSSTIELVGKWDHTRFFLYSEETDYSRRIRESGGRILFTPSAVVRHRGAGSGSSNQLEALLSVNKVRYFRKWHGPTATAAFFGVAVLHNLLRLGRPAARASLTALLSPRARRALPGSSR